MNGYASQRPNTATTLSVIHSNTKIVCATMKRPVPKQAGESLGEAPECVRVVDRTAGGAAGGAEIVVTRHISWPTG